MSAGMNMEEAQKIANKMSFTSAVYNALNAKCVPYRKATKIKLGELLDIAKDVDKARTKGEHDMQEFVENRCRELGIDYTLIFTCNSLDFQNNKLKLGVIFNGTTKI